MLKIIYCIFRPWREKATSRIGEFLLKQVRRLRASSLSQELEICDDFEDEYNDDDDNDDEGNDNDDNYDLYIMGAVCLCVCYVFSYFNYFGR